MSNFSKQLAIGLKRELDENPIFHYINTSYHIQALQEQFIPDIATGIIFGLVYPVQPNTFTPACIGSPVNHENESRYFFGVSLFREDFGANLGMIGSETLKGAYDFEADLQNVLDRNTLGIGAVLGAEMRTASYNPVGFVRLQKMYQCHITMEYLIIG